MKALELFVAIYSHLMMSLAKEELLVHLRRDDDATNQTNPHCGDDRKAV